VIAAAEKHPLQVRRLRVTWPLVCGDDRVIATVGRRAGGRRPPHADGDLSTGRMMRLP